MPIFSRGDEGKKGPRVHTLPLLPLRDIIVFPHMVVPLFVGRPKSIAALEDAMANPERHRNLLVRVAGYSDYFVLLSPDIQREILSRTEHAL